MKKKISIAVAIAATLYFWSVLLFGEPTAFRITVVPDLTDVEKAMRKFVFLP
jgi:hypothetical protein